MKCSQCNIDLLIGVITCQDCDEVDNISRKSYIETIGILTVENNALRAVAEAAALARYCCKSPKGECGFYNDLEDALKAWREMKK